VLQIAQVMVARDNDFRPRPDSTSEDGVVGWVVANDRSDFCGLDEMRQRGVTEEQLARGDFGFEQTTAKAGRLRTSSNSASSGALVNRSSWPRCAARRICRG
jgi:hypothetical protein